MSCMDNGNAYRAVQYPCDAANCFIESIVLHRSPFGVPLENGQ
jgi:hypothetical protein